MKLILSRLLGECISLADFQKILSKPLCNVDKKNFFSKLDIVGLSRNYVEDSEIQKLNAKNIKLFDSLKGMCSSTNNYKDFLELGIVETINYLSNGAIQFLKQHPILCFTLIFLHYSKCKQDSSEMTLREIFDNEAGLTTKTITLPKTALDAVLYSLPHLKNEIEPKLIKNNITMYQLLDGYRKFNSRRFFKWRLKNGMMPDFFNENLSRKFGHKEELGYINYLKEARPNMAANILWLQQGNSTGGISSKT